jgi:hypothetical protein
VQLPKSLVVPETDWHVDAPAPEVATFESADRDAFSPGLTSADVAKRRYTAWQINRQAGEPKLENCNGDLIGYVERHPSARDAGHGTASRLVSKPAFHWSNPEGVRR